MTQALWVAFSLYGDRDEPPENAVARRLINLQLATAGTLLRSGGEPALEAMMQDWSDDDRRFLSVTPMAHPPATVEGAFEVRRMPANITAWVQTGDNSGYLLKYDVRTLREQYRPTSVRISSIFRRRCCGWEDWVGCCSAPCWPGT